MTENRRNRLRKRCSDKKIDGYLTFDQSDLFYLSGFPSEGCFILVSRAGDFIFAPLLLAEQAKTLTANEKGLTVVSDRSLLKSLGKILEKNHLKKIGYDSSKVTVSLYNSLSSCRAVKWIPLNGFVLSQRMVKESGEIKSISQACQITVESQKTCQNNLAEGEQEKEVSYRLENLFRKNGSPKIAFETIIAFDEHSSYPHHVVTEKRLKKNSVVLMDLGCTVNGYRSDLTRTSFFGKISPQFSKIYGIVENAQREGIAAVRSGVSAGKIDLVCRKIIEKAGYGDFFVHGTGHGVGLDIHEPPRLGIGSKEILREGMVVTVEPGIYLPGEFGVRIEDTLLVTRDGCRVLTTNRNGKLI